MTALEVSVSSPTEVLAPTCGVVYPGPGDSSLRCRRDDGHRGSHQDGDKVWRSHGTVPDRELPAVSPELLARCVTALHVEGAWCGDCDFESGPCGSCERDLAGYARAVLRVVGMTADDRRVAVCRACGATDHPSGCAQDLAAVLQRSVAPCAGCTHLAREHSREEGVGCLHRNETSHPRRFCPCLEPGTSGADQ